MSSLQPMKMSNSSKSHTKKTILVKCTYYNRRYERNQLYCLQVKSNEKKDESKKNLFYNLPEDLRSKIYEYDDTFRKKFDEVLHELIYLVSLSPSRGGWICTIGMELACETRCYGRS